MREWGTRRRGGGRKAEATRKGGGPPAMRMPTFRRMVLASIVGCSVPIMSALVLPVWTGGNVSAVIAVGIALGACTLVTPPSVLRSASNRLGYLRRLLLRWVVVRWGLTVVLLSLAIAAPIMWAASAGRKVEWSYVWDYEEDLFIIFPRFRRISVRCEEGQLFVKYGSLTWGHLNNEEN